MVKNDITEIIIGMEKAALDRWGKGDPSGFLDISDDDVCYFDPFTEKRIDGKAKLTELYEGLRGKIYFDRFELINPKVQEAGNAAVLSFNYVSYSGEHEDRWNCTEIYENKDGRWKIIHTHWSPTVPGLTK